VIGKEYWFIYKFKQAGMRLDAAADWKFCSSAGPVYYSFVTESAQDQSVYGLAQDVYQQCGSKF